jgi:hypothetical protein
MWYQSGNEEANITRLWFQRTEAGAGNSVLTPEDRPVSKVVTVSPISWQLDSEQLTEFKVSNLSITVENFENEWDPGNPEGHFAPDAAATDGYEPYWTKFQIRSGFQLADGTKEYVNLFTGMAVEFRRNSKDRNVQIDIYGQEAYMLNQAAEDIATHITDEDAGTGDGTTTEFETVNVGVGGINEVKVAGVTLVEGDHYEVSQRGETGLPAKVTFANAPDLGEHVLISYFHWPLGEEFNDLVTLLVDGWLNSDPINSTDIQPFVVANNVINSQEFTSEADWESGTLTRIDTTTYPGSMVLDWQNSAFRELTDWDDSLSGWTIQGLSTGISIASVAGSNRIQFTRAAGGAAQIDRFIDRAFTRVIGSWEFKAQLFTDSPGDNPVPVQILNVKLFREQGVAGFDSSFWISRSHPCTFFGQSFAQPDNAEHTYKVVRYPNNVIKLYVDGVLAATSTYSGTAQSIGFGAAMRSAAITPVFIWIRDISTPTATATGVWESPVGDWTTIPFAWGPFLRSIDLDRNGESAGSTILFETNVSADNFSTSDGYLTLSSTDTVPNSTVRRYWKVRITLTVDQRFSVEPVINNFTIQAFSSSIPVILPDLAGQNVYEAIQSLAAFANYEIGITSDQVFFFRPKSTIGDPVFDIAQNDLTEEVMDLQNGYERVYSKVEITYGRFVKRIEAADDEADSPATRFLKKTFEYTADDNIRIAETADIATAMSRDYFARLSVLRRRFKVKTKFLPQLELSDLISCSFAFDPDGSQRKLLDAVPAKIIGARYDTDRYSCEFDLEEVPT